MSGYLHLVSTVAAVVVLCYVSGSSAQENVVEALVVLDKASRERWEAQAKIAGNTVEEEVMSVMYEVKVLYDSLKSQGVDLSFRLKDGEVRYWDENIVPDHAFITIDGIEMIDSGEAFNYFWDWTEYEDFDVAIFIVGFEFIDSTTLGLGHMDRVCRGGVALIKPVYDYSIVSTIAHEVAHILGLHHDGDEDYNDPCDGDASFIMSPYEAEPGNLNIHHWSSCSARDLASFMPYRTCLSPASTVEIYAKRFGRLVDAEETCRRVTGGGYVSRLQYEGHYNDLCSRLVCENDLTVTKRGDMLSFNGQFPSTFTPEGMQCAKGRRCNKGECERANRTPRSWSWSCPYGDTPRMLNYVTSCRQVKSEGHCAMDLFKNICCDTC